MDNNLAVLQAVKESIAEEVKKHTYNFNEGIDESKLRCPNEREQKEWLKNVLRVKYFCDPQISLSQYRTIKGEIRKGHFNVAINFLAKLRNVSDIRASFERYKTTKSIQDITVPVTFPEPVKVCSIEININKEE